MRTPRMIALATLTLAAALVAAPPAGAIVGGQPADHPFSFMASIQVKDQSDGQFKHFCGASLIAPQWVVTAAHCVAGSKDNPEGFQVRVGSADSTTGGEVRAVSKIVSNPGYGEKPTDGTTDPFQGDIALVKLSAPVSELPVHIGLFTQPQPVTAIGWGLACADAGCTTYMYPTHLQQLETEILPPKACADAIAPATYNPQLNPCVGSLTKKANPAGRDSGGPVLAKAGGQWLLLGVCSHWITPDGVHWEQGATPLFYTSVPAHLDWIVKTIATA